MAISSSGTLGTSSCGTGGGTAAAGQRDSVGSGGGRRRRMLAGSGPTSSTHASTPVQTCSPQALSSSPTHAPLPLPVRPRSHLAGHLDDVQPDEGQHLLRDLPARTPGRAAARCLHRLGHGALDVVAAGNGDEVALPARRHRREENGGRGGRSALHALRRLRHSCTATSPAVHHNKPSPAFTPPPPTPHPHTHTHTHTHSLVEVLDGKGPGPGVQAPHVVQQLNVGHARHQLQATGRQAKQQAGTQRGVETGRTDERNTDEASPVASCAARKVAANHASGTKTHHRTAHQTPSAPYTTTTRHAPAPHGCRRPW